MLPRQGGHKSDFRGDGRRRGRLRKHRRLTGREPPPSRPDNHIGQGATRRDGEILPDVHIHPLGAGERLLAGGLQEGVGDDGVGQAAFHRRGLLGGECPGLFRCGPTDALIPLQEFRPVRGVFPHLPDLVGRELPGRQVGLDSLDEAALGDCHAPIPLRGLDVRPDLRRLPHCLKGRRLAREFQDGLQERTVPRLADKGGRLRCRACDGPHQSSGLLHQDLAGLSPGLKGKAGFDILAGLLDTFAGRPRLRCLGDPGDAADSPSERTAPESEGDVADGLGDLEYLLSGFEEGRLQLVVPDVGRRVHLQRPEEILLHLRLYPRRLPQEFRVGDVPLEVVPGDLRLYFRRLRLKFRISENVFPRHGFSLYLFRYFFHSPVGFPPPTFPVGAAGAGACALPVRASICLLTKASRVRRFASFSGSF